MSGPRTERARVAGLSKTRKSNDPTLVDARRNLRAANLEQHIQKAVAEAPPLTADQRLRLALLLAGGSA